MEKNLIISGKKLFEARRAIKPKLSQDLLAEKIGISRASMNVWEKREDIEITPEQAAKLTKVLRVNINDLIADLTQTTTTREDGNIEDNIVNSYQKIIEDRTNYRLVHKSIFEQYRIVPVSEMDNKEKYIDEIIATNRELIANLKKQLSEVEKQSLPLKSNKADK